MNILKLVLGKKIFKGYVYNHTEKPKEYVHVDEPKSLQDYRQVQYNNWCKINGVYNGSYLPENPNTLTKKGKGWVETKGKPDGTTRFFKRKSRYQFVRYDCESDTQYAHWHWLNGSSDKDRKSKSYAKAYLDRYGKECSKTNKRHHLGLLDREYKEKRKSGN